MIKGIKNIWKEEYKNESGWWNKSYNDKRSVGRRLKLVCGVWGKDYYWNMEKRDKCMGKIREFIKKNKKEGVWIDGWKGGCEIVVYFSVGD